MDELVTPVLEGGGPGIAMKVRRTLPGGGPARTGTPNPPSHAMQINSAPTSGLLPTSVRRFRISELSGSFLKKRIEEEKIRQIRKDKNRLEYK